MVTQADADSVERRAPLTRERVLRAAIELADRDGLEALSMRKLGQELGVDAMALYRHVRSKDDLFDGIIERRRRRDRAAGRGRRLEGRPARAGDGGPARSCSATPGRGACSRSAAPAGSAAIAYIESVLAILRDGGFSLDLAHHALHVLDSRIFGFNQDLFDDSGRAEPSPDVAEMFGPAMAARYPRVTELADVGQPRGRPRPCDDDVEFAFGLDLILDGLDATPRGDRAAESARQPEGAVRYAGRVRPVASP